MEITIEATIFVLFLTVIFLAGICLGPTLPAFCGGAWSLLRGYLDRQAFIRPTPDTRGDSGRMGTRGFFKGLG